MSERVVARWSALFGVLTLLFSACNTPDAQTLTEANTWPGPIPAPSGPGITSPVTIGQSCVTNDPGHICLGLKIAVYTDSSGAPVQSQAEALANVQMINQIHAQCNIGFQIEEYVQIDPTKYGLAYHTANLGDLDTLRADFEDYYRFLVLTTGSWNRSGTLGQTGANAWTAMPGGGPYGAVFEAPVENYSYIYAHELGHYLGLSHVSDASDVMNAIIYSSSTKLTADQCATERATATGFWAAVVRTRS